MHRVEGDWLCPVAAFFLVVVLICLGFTLLFVVHAFTLDRNVNVAVPVTVGDDSSHGILEGCIIAVVALYHAQCTRNTIFLGRSAV